MRPSWDLVAVSESGLTATLAGLTAAYFLRRHARGRDPSGRQTASLALGMSAAGAALMALQSVAVALGGERPAGMTVAAGLPALVGQALLAMLVMRRKGWK
jgi:hypothetical protein